MPEWIYFVVLSQLTRVEGPAFLLFRESAGPTWRCRAPAVCQMPCRFPFLLCVRKPCAHLKTCWLLCLTRCWSDTSQRRWTSRLSLSTVVCVKRFCHSQIANRQSVPMATFGSGKLLLLIFQFCVTQTTVKCLSKVYVAHAIRLEKSCYYKTWCGFLPSVWLKQDTL